MGYPNGGLGDYINVQNNSVITDAMYARIPSLMRQFYRPKTVATPPAPVPVKVATVTPLPPRFSPTQGAPISPVTANAANAVAPIVAAAGGPTAAAAAVVPAITTALTQPPTEKVRVTGGSNFLAPVLKRLQDLIPANSPAAPDTSPGSAPAAAVPPSPTVFNADGTPANQTSTASVANGPDFLTTVKNLPPVALAAVAVGAYVLFRRK